ncbi:cytochrome b/b6 domain-containing protein [Vibrio sp. AND4]|uniref:cytochrome b/b6 domain-containing protein n=1 Tax=Vibrio sp. AND4 TaxID=314289 RepID=UPI0005C72F85
MSTLDSDQCQKATPHDPNNPMQHYDVFSKWLHWIMAVIIIYATVAGYGMLFVMDKPQLFHVLSTLNMSFATIASALLIVRWGWSFFRKTPELPDTIPTAQKSIAKLAHGVLYLVMFVVFISGFLMLNHEYTFFWLFIIQNPISNPEVNAFFFTVHRFGCAILASLVLLHVLAALKHHFVNNNDVLKSMAFDMSKQN